MEVAHTAIPVLQERTMLPMQYVPYIVHAVGESSFWTMANKMHRRPTAEYRLYYVPYLFLKSGRDPTPETG